MCRDRTGIIFARELCAEMQLVYPAAGEKSNSDSIQTSLSLRFKFLMQTESGGAGKGRQ